MTISRMQNPRQMYGLGSLVKSITKPFKSVAKGVKSFAKSDLGKAAIFAGLGMIPFGATGTSLFSRIGSSPLVSKILSSKALSKIGDVALDVGVGSLVAGGLDKFQRSQLPEPEMRIMGRTEEELDQIEKDLRQNYKNLGYTDAEIDLFVEQNMKEYGRDMNAAGGRIGFAMGPDNPEQNAMQASGIMGLPLNQNPAGVTELDLRETGGFIPPVGVKEKADDIPAMLSNNEFVFTADAVRGMGDGDVNKGAERMYSMMKQLENGGRV